MSGGKCPRPIMLCFALSSLYYSAVSCIQTRGSETLCEILLSRVSWELRPCLEDGSTSTLLCVFLYLSS